MRELTGKAAFVTGGASGIGLALGRAFAEAGMRVVLADIEQAPLAAAVKNLKGIGPDVRGVVCDVTHASSVDHAAKMAFDAVGKVHILSNMPASSQPAELIISRSKNGAGCVT
jgi:NAD(P)-dependent dehydrogenase (short-subunit alcohol dehydrogenase family)